jgi:glycosyltransferase involved in cell wall biosynthesis
MSAERSALSVLAVSPVGVVGGAEVLLLTVLSGLERCGVRTRLIALGEGPLLTEAALWGLHSSESGPRLSLREPATVLRGIHMVRRAARRWRPDVILANHPKGQLLCRLALPAGRRIAHVAMLHDPPDPRAVQDRLCARFPDLRIANTEETSRAYAGMGARPAPTVIEPAVDPQRLADAARRGRAETIFEGCGLPAFTGPRILMVGRMQRFKGGSDFIDMAARLLEDRPAQFMMIGPDEANAPGVRQELSREIADRGLEASIGVAGRAHSDDLSAAMAQATLLVHPAHREPFGMVLVEALCLGTPVVAYRAPGPTRILARGGGALVPVGDVAALTATVASALDDGSILDRWRAATRPAAELFEARAMVERYLSALSGASRHFRPAVPQERQEGIGVTDRKAG